MLRIPSPHIGDRGVRSVECRSGMRAKEKHTGDGERGFSQDGKTGFFYSAVFELHFTDTEI